MATLSGRVMLAGEEPAPSAVVEVSNASGDIVDQVVVDDQGRYTYHLTSGSWVLRAWDARGHRAQRRVDLARNEDKILDLALRTPREDDR
jgi:hypothetical protein